MSVLANIANTSKNETIWPKVVSFLLSSVMLSLVFSFVANRLFFDDAFAQEANQEINLNELSTKKWAALVAGTSQALLGNSINAAELQDLVNAPTESRQKQLQQAITTWLQSDSFAKQQASDWRDDYFPVLRSKSANLSEGVALWDYTQHDQWLVDAIQSNMPFDSFLSSQLFGTEAQRTDSSQPERLATASWYRANQFQVTDHAETYKVVARAAPENEPANPTTLQPFQPFQSFQEPTPLGLSDLILNDSSWVYQETPVFRRNQLRTLSDAIASIRQSEIKDWELLIQGDAVRNWYQKQTAHPKPPPAERIFAWPSPEQRLELRDDNGHRASKSPLRIGSGGFAPTVYADIEEPLRRSQEWTVVLNCNFGHDLIASSTSSPRRILTQQAHSTRAPATNDTLSQSASNPYELRLEITNGYLQVSLVHDAPFSMIQVRTTKPIEIDTWTQIAVSYDGTNRAHSLRIALDGEYVGLNYIADTLIRDFVGESSKAPAKEESYKLLLGDSTNPDHLWELEDIEVYRTVLSPPELLGKIENTSWQDWQDFSETEKLAWIEYYARRIDPNWRYERETLRYYLINEYLIWETIPLTPTLPGPLQLVQMLPLPQDQGQLGNSSPNEKHAPRRPLFPWNMMDSESIHHWIAAIGTVEIRWDTLEAPWKESISHTEVARQWQHLIERTTKKLERSSQIDPGTERRGVQASLQRFAESRLPSLAKQFMDRNWDRRAMMLDMLLSPEWIAIAIDSIE